MEDLRTTFRFVNGGSQYGGGGGGVPPGPSVGNDQRKVASVGKAHRAPSRHGERSPTVGKRRIEPKAQKIRTFHFL